MYLFTDYMYLCYIFPIVFRVWFDPGVFAIFFFHVYLILFTNIVGILCVTTLKPDHWYFLKFRIRDRDIKGILSQDPSLNMIKFILNACIFFYIILHVHSKVMIISLQCLPSFYCLLQGLFLVLGKKKTFGKLHKVHDYKLNI